MAEPQRVLGLDVSTRCGWALLEREQGSSSARLVDHGLIQADSPLADFLTEFGYPLGYIIAARSMARKISAIVDGIKPDLVIIEETNLGRNRYTQKFLEWIHFALLHEIRKDQDAGLKKVIYLSSSQWRHAIGLEMSKADKRANARLSRAKRIAREEGVDLDKKALGVRGRVTKKHLVVRWANALFNLTLKQKDNDTADAIGVAVAFIRGAVQCDGTGI